MPHLFRFTYSPWFLVGCVVLSFWVGLGWLPLFDLDEGAFTEATREMLASGNFSATYLDGEPRYDKPIFFYWLQSASITLFGYNEWAFRLPSVIAGSLWVWAVFSFVKQFVNRTRAQIAALFIANCLWVALIARSAIADALLNLFLSLTLFDIWRYIQNPKQKYALRFYLWMALGTLTKGPVAVAIPLVVSFLWLVSNRQLTTYYKAYFNFSGWAVYLLMVSPWVVAVYFEQGLGFFEGFILEHNLKRFSDTRESHGGTLFYYVGMLPVIILPLSGLLWWLFKRRAALVLNPFYRFLAIWFGVIFVLFSFSKTQLPHYILNGCVPLIILLASVSKLGRGHRWNLIFPLIFISLFVFLPEILSLAAASTPGYDGANLARWQETMPSYYRAYAIALLVFVLAVTFVPKIPVWQRLALTGVAFNVFMFTVLVKFIWGVQQAPLHHVMDYLEQHHPEQTVHTYRMHMPTFSVYRQKITPLDAPKTAGSLCVVRMDRIHKLEEAVAPHTVARLFQSGGLVLTQIQSKSED